MKKFPKILLISLASLLGLIIIAVLIVMWLVLTPARVTPIVNKQANKLLTCQTSIGKIDVTLFRTFPRFGLEIEGLTLINPMEGAPSDTLLHAANVRFAIDLKAFLKHEELIISDVVVNDGKACIYFDADGNANFEIYESSDDEESSGDMPFEFMELGSIKLRNMDVLYVDDSMGMSADLVLTDLFAKAYMKRNGDLTFDIEVDAPVVNYRDHASGMTAEAAVLNGRIKGAMEGGTIIYDVDLTGGSMVYDDPSGVMHARLEPLAVIAKGTMEDGKITFEGHMASDSLYYRMGDDVFADGLAAAVKTSGELVMSEDNLHIRLNDSKININDMPSLDLNGTIDMKGGDIGMGINFAVEEWDTAALLALVPRSFLADMTGLSVDGALTAKGDITGIYNETSMPAVNVDMRFADGRVVYPSVIPFPLHGVQADLFAHIDMNGDTESYTDIRRFIVNTPESYLSTSGTVGNLTGDMRVALNSTLDVLLDEISPMIPEDMYTTTAGRIKGNAYTELRMSQLEKLQFNRMKLRGNLVCSEIDVNYEGTILRTPFTTMNFALPNPHPANAYLGFASVHIESQKLTIAIPEESIYAELQNPVVTIQTGNLMNESGTIEPTSCDFNFKSLTVTMDDMKAAICNPQGSVMFSASPANPDYYAIDMAYRGDMHSASTTDMKAVLDSAELTLSCAYNPGKQDVMNQWSPKGTLIVNGITIDMDGFSETVKIPVANIAIDPTLFVIKDVKGVIGDSDFALTGYARNLDQYLDNGSPMNGVFNLYASYVDIIPLMNAVSGLGTEDSLTAAQREAANQQEELAGAFMVPAGIEVLFHTKIDEAAFGDTPLRGVDGTITISDRTLILNELVFNTPGADIELTARYDTNKRNHIFMGFSLNVLDIEIAQLVDMFPMVDTLMPMLRSLDGKGEFRTQLEFYTDSMYVPKYTTQLGVASIRGENLQVLPGDMYKRISKMLFFSKKTRNVIDNFSAELTLYQDQIDVYPFEVSMDKYKLIVSGRQNTDMSFDYKIAIAKSPLPFRFAVRVYGDLDDYNIRRVRNNIPRNFRPTARGEISGRQLDFRNFIRNEILKSFGSNELEGNSIEEVINELQE